MISPSASSSSVIAIICLALQIEENGWWKLSWGGGRTKRRRSSSRWLTGIAAIDDWSSSAAAAASLDSFYYHHHSSYSLYNWSLPASSARDHEMMMMLMLVMRYTKRELLVRWFLPISPAMVSRRRRIITYMGSKMVRIMRGSLSILRRLLFLCTRNCNMESARVRLPVLAGWLLTDWLIGNAVV